MSKLVRKWQAVCVAAGMTAMLFGMVAFFTTDVAADTRDRKVEFGDGTCNDCPSTVPNPFGGRGDVCNFTGYCSIVPGGIECYYTCVVG